MKEGFEVNFFNVPYSLLDDLRQMVGDYFGKISKEEPSEGFGVDVTVQFSSHEGAAGACEWAQNNRIMVSPDYD